MKNLYLNVDDKKINGENFGSDKKYWSKFNECVPGNNWVLNKRMIPAKPSYIKNQLGGLGGISLTLSTPIMDTFEYEFKASNL